MSRTLNLAEGLLSLGRNQHALGRTHDALSTFSRLSRLRELSPAVAEETQACLGAIQLGRKKFARARRHYRVALRYDPDNALYHRQLARALAQKDEQHADQAAHHYRQALEQDPEQIESLVELGLLCVKTGRMEEGLAHLKRAVELRPNDPDVLGNLVKGLRWSGRLVEARKELRVALFRNSTDPRFRQLWHDFQYRLLRREQLRRSKVRLGDSAPVLLPFPAPPGETEAPARPISDTEPNSAAVPVPLPGRPERCVDQRHVQ